MWPRGKWREMTDAVEKRFCSFERARLIQDQTPMRNVDSKIQSPRFDLCVFLLYSLFAATFSTASTHSDHGADRIRATQAMEYPTGIPRISRVSAEKRHHLGPYLGFVGGLSEVGTAAAQARYRPNVPLQGLQDRPMGGNNGYSPTNENLLIRDAFDSFRRAERFAG